MNGILLEASAGTLNETLKGVMETAMTQVKADMFDMMAMGLPIGLSIAGTFMAIRCGWSFFRSFAH